MKPIYISLISTLLTLTSYTQTQPQFKFWLAFEDSIGQRDTLWVIIDSSANATITINDSSWGEIPLGQLDSNKFHVYYKGAATDSFKVYATATFKKNASVNIQAQNYHLPISVRWDSNLLRKNGLPWEIKTAFLYNTFTFFNPNIPGNEVWDLFFTDTFFLPYDLKNSPLSYYMPLQLYISNEEPISITESKESKKTVLFPNPANDLVFIESQIGEAILKLFTVDGKLLVQELFNRFSTLNVSNYPRGVYFIQIQNSKTNEILPLYIN